MGAGVTIMLTGVAVLGLLAGSLASFFRLDTSDSDRESPSEQEPAEETAASHGVDPDLLVREMAQLQAQVDRMKELISKISSRSLSHPWSNFPLYLSDHCVGTECGACVPPGARYTKNGLSGVRAFCCWTHSEQLRSGATPVLRLTPKCLTWRSNCREHGPESSSSIAKGKTPFAHSFKPMVHRDNILTTLVEVKGLEPSASTLRKCGSQCFDQVLSEDFPGSGVAVLSGPLTIPPLPSR